MNCLINDHPCQLYLCFTLIFSFLHSYLQIYSYVFFLQIGRIKRPCSFSHPSFTYACCVHLTILGCSQIYQLKRSKETSPWVVDTRELDQLNLSQLVSADMLARYIFHATNLHLQKIRGPILHGSFTSILLKQEKKNIKVHTQNHNRQVNIADYKTPSPPFPARGF